MQPWNSVSKLDYPGDLGCGNLGGGGCGDNNQRSHQGCQHLKERKQAKLVEKQRKEDEAREQIRLEEKNKLGAIENS